MPAGEARVERLVVGGRAEAWSDLGLVVDVDGTIPFLTTSIRIDASKPEGSMSWELSGVDADVVSIDGLDTRVVAAGRPQLTDHPNGAFELDHVVVLTSSLERTCDAVAEATGAPLKRIRDLGRMRQGFHRVGRGGLIVEVVERSELRDETSSFWGLVINVVDLDAAAAAIGPDRIGDVTDAVQPGRRIATLRDTAGLGLPVALMSPAV